MAERFWFDCLLNSIARRRPVLGNVRAITMPLRSWPATVRASNLTSSLSRSRAPLPATAGPMFQFLRAPLSYRQFFAILPRPKDAPDMALWAIQLDARKSIYKYGRRFQINFSRLKNDALNASMLSADLRSEVTRNVALSGSWD